MKKNSEKIGKKTFLVFNFNQGIIYVIILKIPNFDAIWDTLMTRLGLQV